MVSNKRNGFKQPVTCAYLRYVLLKLVISTEKGPLEMTETSCAYYRGGHLKMCLCFILFYVFMMQTFRDKEGCPTSPWSN